MGGKDGGGKEKKAPAPQKRQVGGTEAAEPQSLIRRSGLRATKTAGRTLGGGTNLGGR
jgi:hypothetical protein